MGRRGVTTAGRQVGSAAELARRTGLAMTTCARYLSGASRPSPLALRRLKEAGIELKLPPFRGRHWNPREPRCHYRLPGSAFLFGCALEFGPTTFWTRDLEKVNCRTCLTSRAFSEATKREQESEPREETNRKTMT
jgi:transcriptional regulator with XRE-family HTH domain